MHYGPKSERNLQATRTINALTGSQRRLFDLLMLNRTGNRAEAQFDALLVVQNAVRRKAVQREIAYWTHPASCRCMEI